ncbi:MULTISPECIES: hypothetical protein [Serratia]|uniref:hypothetical protein n=1 Tax=Serratia TaxID=613 RepID=UPI0027E4376A|nr:hypothetical protein [Serratia marcescens]MCH4195238.1 hypothetical protein [Serratia liquefaciens]MCH4231454.1 hypothetical protein [Serratia liquefaciens]MCH4263141.1 hypothetical protein [Serratia liquefaciens]MCI1213176.1 hypothetical protein [Serratia liquefaciens]MCI1234533.1 hypothetical protein [Serratia liquefaciens]
MKLKSISLGVFLFAVSSSVMAIDGYKGVKFGASFNELNASKLCTWKKYDGNIVNGIDSYVCKNFKFSGGNTFAVAFFIDGKFERLAIPIGNNTMSVIDSLKKKYGEPSSSFTSEEFERAQSFGGDINVRFDKDTIIINVTRDPETKQDKTHLIYTSPQYDAMYKKLQEKSIEGDI